MEADYVIVGAGSAGCVLANRLSADGRAQILLIEAGGADRHPMIHIPAGYSKILAHKRLTWGFHTEAEAELDGRAIPYPRGRVLGGSSAINGLGHVRGDPTDYDLWAQRGCLGWSYADLLPYFMRSERAAPGEGRGTEGELPVVPLADRPVVLDALAEAAPSVGLPFNPDMNGPTRDGVAYFQQTRRGHRRASAAHAFLAPARARPNLRVLTGALALGLTLDGTRASGVRVRHRGVDITVRARREVVMAAGAIGTPHLLLLSGLGPAEQLAEHGIPVIADLPGVGAELQDHFMVRMAWRLAAHRWSANRQIQGWRLAVEVARWALLRRGPLTWSPSMLSAFARTEPGLAAPDIQIIVGPVSWVANRPGVPDTKPGLTLGVWRTRPDSRGHVRLRSADPADAPAISPRFLTAAADRDATLRGMRLARQWLAAPALADAVREEMSPGAAAADDAALLAYARAAGTTVYHPCGTVRMGIDPTAPLDPQLRLRGIAGLRVADASVFPTIPISNINATVLAVAEKAADLVRADTA